MFKKSHPLQSKSEIILRNIVVIAMIAFFSIFLIVPIGIAFAGSFHEWNPLSGTYNFLGLENYKEVFTSSLFGKSMLNTLIFSVVVIIFRVGLGLGIAYAIYSPLVKHKSFFRAIYYMPVVTPMVAVAFVWKFMYNPQIGTINQIFGIGCELADESEDCIACSYYHDDLERFWLCGSYVYGRTVFAAFGCIGSGKSRRSEWMANVQIHYNSAAETDDTVCSNYFYYFLYSGLCSDTDYDGGRPWYSYLSGILYHL